MNTNETAIILWLITCLTIIGMYSIKTEDNNWSTYYPNDKTLCVSKHDAKLDKTFIECVPVK